MTNRCSSGDVRFKQQHGGLRLIDPTLRPCDTMICAIDFSVMWTSRIHCFFFQAGPFAIWMYFCMYLQTVEAQEDNYREGQAQ